MAEDLQGIRPGRLVSLDAFRGMTIAAMLLVNNAGDWNHVFPPLEHARWHGCTATDLIFPFFLFILGVAMTFSFARRLRETGSRSALLLPIVRRTLILIALGLILSVFTHMAFRGSYRWLGVLQRIGFCYFLGSLILLGTGVRGQIIWTVGILLAYYLAMKLVPVPGYGPGVLDPEGNLSAYIDSRVMGHFNPEGILSTLPALATTLTGILAGHWLRDPTRNGNEKVAGFCAAGTILFLVAALWKFDFPLNKKIWTSSYVLHTTAFALFTLGTFYWIIDVKKRAAWCKPFVVYGTNAIAAYFGASAVAYSTIWIRWQDAAGQTVYLKTWLYNTLVATWVPGLVGLPAGSYVASAVYPTVFYVLPWMGLMWILYRKGIFIKV